MNKAEAFSKGKKKVCYFASRIGILITDKNCKNQSFFEGHKNKICCLSVHPSRKVIATGETCNRPCIHFWRSSDGVGVSCLQTMHTGGVIGIAFSKEGDLVASIGMNRLFDIQIADWKASTILAYKNTGCDFY
jgi:microtubule-associated protein-like 6